MASGHSILEALLHWAMVVTSMLRLNMLGFFLLLFTLILIHCSLLKRNVCIEVSESCIICLYFSGDISPEELFNMFFGGGFPSSKWYLPFLLGFINVG